MVVACNVDELWKRERRGDKFTKMGNWNFEFSP